MIQKLYIKLSRSSYLAVAFTLALASILAMIPVRIASAGQLVERSLTLSTSANGSTTAGANATHVFDFILPANAGNADIQAMEFKYCDDPVFPANEDEDAACTPPTGLDVTGTLASVQLNGGAALGSWALGATDDAPTANRLRITKATTEDMSAGARRVTVTFNGIVNPTTDNETFFVRIKIFQDATIANAGGNTLALHKGAVAAATGEQIDITSIVKETLTFSVGTTWVAENGGACDPLTGSTLALGDADGVLSTQTAYDKFSYFRVSTNGVNGTVVQYSGDTLEDGTNSIDPVSDSGEVSDVGAEQFGLGVDTTEANHATSTSAGRTLDPVAPYDAADGTITDGGEASFAFDVNSVTAPVTIAQTGATEIVDCDSVAVRYLGNIALTTEAGTYTTTITYIATPTF